MIHSFSSFS